MINIKSYQVFFLFLALFFLMSVQSKINNMEAVRPLNYIGLIVLALLNVSYIFHFKFKKFLRIFLLNQTFLLIVIFFSVFLFSFFSGERALKDSLYATYWSLSFLFFIFLVFESAKYDNVLRLLVYAILFFSIFSTVVAILIKSIGVEYNFGLYILKQNYWTPNRLHGFMGEPTSFGALVGFSLIGFFCTGIRSKPLFISFLLLLYALVFSGSRNSVVSIVLCLFFWFFFFNRNKINFTIFIQILFCGLFLSLFIFDHSFFSQFEREVSSDVNEDSRLYIWSQVISLMKDSSVYQLAFGHGAGSLQEEYRSSFNSVLQLIYDYGILLAIFYIFLIIISIYIGLHRYYKTLSFLYKYGVLSIVFGFSFNFFISWFPSWFFNFATFSLIIGIFLTSIPTSFVVVNSSKNA